MTTEQFREIKEGDKLRHTAWEGVYKVTRVGAQGILKEIVVSKNGQRGLCFTEYHCENWEKVNA